MMAKHDDINVTVASQLILLSVLTFFSNCLLLSVRERERRGMLSHSSLYFKQLNKVDTHVTSHRSYHICKDQFRDEQKWIKTK